MADQLDMEQRDINDLNKHIKVQFHDIFGEPEGSHSIDGVWKCSFKCFTGTFACCYKVLTILCAVPAAFCWGCEFACLACCTIWCWTPSIFHYEMCCVPVRKLYTLCIGAVCGPICETVGLMCSKIRISKD